MMDKGVIQTIAVVVTIVLATWSIGGDVKANTAAIVANTTAIAALRADVRELRSLVISHIAGHHHDDPAGVTDASDENRRSRMKEYKPEGIQSLVPHVFVKNLPEYLEFVKSAFGVEVITETKNDAGVTFYATLLFDDTVFFAQEPEGKHTPSVLYLYVPDLDVAYKRAVNAGAISISEPAEQYHGDSLAILEDKSGNQWFLAYANEILDDEEIRERRQKESK